MDKAKFIISAVREIVPEVYLVGGSVRDMLLDKEPKDYDFATPLLPDVVEEKAKAAGRHVYGIGKKFGTIGFKVQDENGKFQYVEVTTFRKEAYTPGNRKPQVEYVQGLQEDLSRRDFTMNAIAFDTDYIDPFGGRLDILNGKIKAVGKATDRFKEDPLRMLRAARFHSQFGFEIDPNLIGIMRKLSDKILDISRERWVQEIDKLLVGAYPGYGLGLLFSSGVGKYILPELVGYTHNSYLWGEVIDMICAAPPDADVRWGKLLSRLSFPILHPTDIMSERKTVRREAEINAEMARGVGLRLKFSNARLQTIDETVTNKKETTNG